MNRPDSSLVHVVLRIENKTHLSGQTWVSPHLINQSIHILKISGREVSPFLINFIKVKKIL